MSAEEAKNSRKRPVEEAAADVTLPATTTTTTTEAPTVAAATSTTAAAAAAAAAAPVKPPPAKKADTGTKAYKGLRHFSMMVCKKVEEKGTTSYNEVADELVSKVVEERRKDDPNAKYDEKNIRRRVYDALNVLMAMDIITKDKKAITWKGLPTSASQDLDMLARERDFRRQEVERKRHALQELLIQQVCFRNLVEHNRTQEAAAKASSSSSGGGTEQQQQTTTLNKIPLPFIVVNTNSSAVIQCNMSRDLTDVMFDFSMPFEINDDNTILKRLGMHKTTLPVLQEMMPEDMLRYCQEHNLLENILSTSTSATTPGAAAVAAVGSSDYQPPYAEASTSATRMP